MLKTKTPLRAVYKLSHAGKTFYRLAYSAEGAVRELAREKGISPEQVEILDEGRKC